MYEAIKKNKLLSFIVILTWIVLIYSYTHYIQESFRNAALNDLKERLSLSNSVIYDMIGKEYFDRAVSENAITQEEYNNIQDKVTNKLDLLGINTFAIGFPQSGEYYLTMMSSATDDTRYDKVKYFTPYLETYKPPKVFENELSKLLNSEIESGYYFDGSVVGKFYSKVEKRYLSDGQTILVSSSYSIEKFNALLKEHDVEESKRAAYFLLVILPLFLYMLFLFFTEKRQLKYKLLHHHLTGLENIHSLLKTQLNESVLLYVDIEFFSEYNRLYGHNVGNKLIKEFAISMKSYIDSENYRYYSFNGNDFGILIKEINENAIENEVEKIFQYLNNSKFRIDEHSTITLGVKIGVSFFQDVETLFENASSACSIAKKKGLHYYIYNEKKDTKSHLVILEKLVNAIHTDNIKVFYQPIINNTKEVIKYEALIRMNDNEKYLSPFEFLHIAKLSGHYYDLTMIVLNQVIVDVETHKIKASVNLSYDDISNTNHANMIIDLLSKSLYRKNITIELLESSSIEDFSTLLSFINRVKELGLKVAIDDYGAEYSSIENILKVKPDFLKIDGSIVKHIANDKASLTVLSTTTNMAQSLGMHVIAEYVATEEIFDMAKSVGVDLFQGYYYSEPKPLSELL